MEQAAYALSPEIQLVQANTRAGRNDLNFGLAGGARDALTHRPTYCIA